MDIEYRCPDCFEHKQDSRACPHCGYEEALDPTGVYLKPGSILNGQFFVGRTLGAPSGFGIVYRSFDLRLDVVVAIKEYFPKGVAGRRRTDRATAVPQTDSDSGDFQYGLKKFIEEAKTIARFSHPNIMRIRTFFQENGTGYLVMDYYEGQTLEEYQESQGGRLSEKMALDLMMPVMDGLREAHSAKILHRDVKPGNVYITKGGIPILIDFGAARMALGNRSQNLSVIVTPGFAPFEQYTSNGKQGSWTDVYACGATLYHLVTGACPPIAPDRINVDELVPIKQITTGVSQEFSDAVMGALAMKIDDRPQTMKEFQDDLCAHATGVGQKLNDHKDERLSALRQKNEFREGLAITAKAYIACAQRWLDDLDNESAARRCLDKAEKLAISISDWREIVRLWIRLKNVERSKLALQKAKPYGLDVDNLYYEYEFEYFILVDQEKAIEFLKKAEDKATDYNQWQDYANYWADLDSESGVRRCLAQAETIGSQSSAALINIAETWFKVGSESNARRCLTQAEVQAEDRRHSYSWCYIAIVWFKLGSESDAHRCLVHAEKEADHTIGWHEYHNAWAYIADFWYEIGSVRNAHRCMALQEALPMYGPVFLAKAWFKIGSKDDALRCIDKGEVLAKDSNEWCSIAETWIELGSESDARRCLLQAETKAKGSYDLQKIAASWIELGSESDARRCLLQAETKAKGSYDLQKIAASWIELGLESNARRCYTQAKAIETGTFSSTTIKEERPFGEKQHQTKTVNVDDLCYGCFADSRGSSPCPHCGYDSSVESYRLALPPGTILHGQFMVGQKLGIGGFDLTYLGYDLTLQIKVVIQEYFPMGIADRLVNSVKVVPQAGEDAAIIEYGLNRFFESTRLQSKLSHPNIARVRTSFEENGTAYLVRDYYEGQSVQQYLEDSGGRVSENMAVALLLPVMDGLRKVHDAGILHRDVKPANVHITKDGIPILIDFACAVMMGRTDYDFDVIITPGYAPFEQYHSRGNQGPWTDVYACGATLYQMVTGETPQEAFGRDQQDELRPLGELGLDLSQKFCSAVMRALAMRPKDRWQTVKEFQNTLKDKKVKDPAPPKVTTDTFSHRVEETDSDDLLYKKHGPAMIFALAVYLGLPADDLKLDQTFEPKHTGDQHYYYFCDLSNHKYFVVLDLASYPPAYRSGRLNIPADSPISDTSTTPGEQSKSATGRMGYYALIYSPAILTLSILMFGNDNSKLLAIFIALIATLSAIIMIFMARRKTVKLDKTIPMVRCACGGAKMQGSLCPHCNS